MNSRTGTGWGNLGHSDMAAFFIVVFIVFLIYGVISAAKKDQ